jgi:hypothetical protein
VITIHNPLQNKVTKGIGECIFTSFMDDPLPKIVFNGKRIFQDEDEEISRYDNSIEEEQNLKNKIELIFFAYSDKGKSFFLIKH